MSSGWRERRGNRGKRREHRLSKVQLLRRCREGAGTTPRNFPDKRTGSASILSYAIAPALEAGAHGAPVVFTLRHRLVRGHATAGLSGVEASLRRRPGVTLVPVIRLLLWGLAPLWIHEDVLTL